MFLDIDEIKISCIFSLADVITRDRDKMSDF